MQHIRRVRLTRLIQLVVLGMLITAAHDAARIARAQTDPPAAYPAAYDVFLRGSTLYFVDARTGLSAINEAAGARHTLTARGVLFAENGTGAARLAFPDGRIEPFLTIPNAGADTAVHWVVSANRRWLAWSVSRREGGGLSSDLFIADSTAGATSSLALHTSSQQGLGVLPLAITDDGLRIFYTRRADLFEKLPANPPVHQIRQLEVATAETKALPDMPGCPCPAAFSIEGRRFAWLAADPGGGFALRLWDLSLGRETIIGPPQMPPSTAYQQAGHLLFSADGSQALYVASGGRRAALVLVDLGRGEQRIVNGSLTQALRPIWLEGQSALLVSAEGEGTYKLSLDNGLLTQVSTFTYLGSLSGD